MIVQLSSSDKSEHHQEILEHLMSTMPIFESVKTTSLIFSLLSFNLAIAQGHATSLGERNQLVQAISFTDSLLQRTTNELTAVAKDDLEKMRAIYQFVITHIEYDHQAYKGNKRRINRNSTDVMSRRKAVCWGYAELIRDMCRYASIQCETISGYTNTLPFPARALEKANHSWNAVYLEGSWHLLDATWGSGVQLESDYFTSVYGVDYYLTPPQLFIRNHFPLMPMWQLQDCPVSFDQFVQLQFNEQADCEFNYQDSIAAFLKLPRLSQRAKTMMIAYGINKTNANRSQLGHALVDIAIEKKEKGDYLIQQGSQALAIEELEASLQIFDLARAYCSYYPWQNEAHVFTAINLAQAFYSTYHADTTKTNLIADQFKVAKSLLNQSRLKEEIQGQVRTLIEEYLKVLE